MCWSHFAAVWCERPDGHPGFHRAVWCGTRLYWQTPTRPMTLEELAHGQADPRVPHRNGCCELAE